MRTHHAAYIRNIDALWLYLGLQQRNEPLGRANVRGIADADTLLAERPEFSIT